MTQFFLQDVLEMERAQLRLRREKLDLENPNGSDWFGIALSGGGIRSATINMGFLKTLNRFGILKKADYLSTVSGGGYTHEYIQATLKELTDLPPGSATLTDPYTGLFTDEHAERFRQHGEYMTPGLGGWKGWNLFTMAVSFVVSWAMSLISPLLVVGIVYFGYQILAAYFTENPFAGRGLNIAGGLLREYGWLALAGLLALHFVANILANFNLSISKIFNRVEAGLAAVSLLVLAWWLLTCLPGVENHNLDVKHLLRYASIIVLLIVLGYLANPNALSFHRYYRKQLADLYLRFAPQHNNLALHQLFNANEEALKQFIAPYPLINTCLNLQNPTGDDKFKGTKASDYFLLSPLFCGSKLTGYIRTDRFDDYREMTLPAAVTISAAAVNPGMGIYSNPLLSFLMTLFNARLGFWVSNPLRLEKPYQFVFWPWYFFRELSGRIGTNNRMVNISDGGHIENFGAYELLRRGCRLIIASDAGEDAAYSFYDLNNLLIRARNELGLEIRFRDGHEPENTIRPEPSKVYSTRRYAMADIYQWWEDRNPPTAKEVDPTLIDNFLEPKKVGTFVYLKSSVKAPQGKPPLDRHIEPLKYATYKYKIYHADFPHETTSDQFFDPVQWESYFQLGQFMGAEVLGIENWAKFQAEHPEACDVSADALFRYFEDPEAAPLFPETVEAGGEFEAYKMPEVATEGPTVAYQM